MTPLRAPAAALRSVALARNAARASAVVSSEARALAGGELGAALGEWLGSPSAARLVSLELSGNGLG